MKKFLSIYQDLNKDNLQNLGSLYTANVTFIDPAHEIHGLEKLTSYFAALYQSVTSIHFDFHHVLELKEESYVQWDMTFCHKKLAGARPVTVSGITFLRTDVNCKVFYHRDYFDLGAMIYEQLPVFGSFIRLLKRRLGK